jgi:hypothetical protein
MYLHTTHEEKVCKHEMRSVPILLWECAYIFVKGSWIRATSTMCMEKKAKKATKRRYGRMRLNINVPPSFHDAGERKHI